MNRIYEVTFADVAIRYEFRIKKTARYFGKRIRISKAENFDIKMNDEEFYFFRSIHPNETEDAYVEYKGLLYLTAKYLLKYRRCIFHSVSFVWKQKAWLLTGRSGIGKTTQYINWCNAYPDEITMISGDMPILSFEDKIIVHPSAWNGKEKISNNFSAPLGGIVLLKKERSNVLEYADINEKIITVFSQFAMIPRNEVEINTIAGMTERLIESVPIWQFKNDGTEGSTELLRNRIMTYIKSNL